MASGDRVRPGRRVNVSVGAAWGARHGRVCPQRDFAAVAEARSVRMTSPTGGSCGPGVYVRVGECMGL